MRYAEPIISLDKIKAEMENKNLPANHNVSTCVDYVSDKENSKIDLPAPLKILSTTSLKTTNAATDIPNNGNLL